MSRVPIVGVAMTHPTGHGLICGCFIEQLTAHRGQQSRCRLRPSRCIASVHSSRLSLKTRIGNTRWIIGTLTLARKLMASFSSRGAARRHSLSQPMQCSMMRRRRYAFLPKRRGRP